MRRTRSVRKRLKENNLMIQRFANVAKAKTTVFLKDIRKAIKFSCEKIWGLGLNR